jgi:hypothetical protein
MKKQKLEEINSKQSTMNQLSANRNKKTQSKPSKTEMKLLEMMRMNDDDSELS